MDLGKLKIIQQADQIGDMVWDTVIEWSFFERDTIGKQLVRAADSISANLSEAVGRYSFADRKRFAYFARGSLCETINWLQKTSRRGLIDPEKSKVLFTQTDALSFRLNAYIKYLKTTHNQ